MVKKSPARTPKSVPKKAVARKIVVPYYGRLSDPDATVSLPSFGPILIEVKVDASLLRGSVSEIGFVTSGPPEFNRLFSQGCALFIGKSEDDVEFFTLERFLDLMGVRKEEGDWARYVWTALQDVCARLPFDDPLSRAIGKIARLHDEFPVAGPGMDEED